MDSTSCLAGLVGLKSMCGASVPAPVYYLDDIEGITQERLAKLASIQQGSGAALAQDLIDSAVRLMRGDIDSVIPVNYKIKQELASVCSLCTFSGFFGGVTTSGTGIVVKNMSNSRFSSMILDSLQVRINNTGTFDILISGTPGKTITQAFVAGEILTIQNINYETTDKKFSIYFADPTVQVYSITCPASSGCGCGRPGNKTLATEIIIAGYANGVEGSTQWGLLPCIKIKCSNEAIICDLVRASPNIFGLTLLYLVASKAFEEGALSMRINRAASFDKDEKIAYSDLYYGFYRDRFTGNAKKGVLGISQVVNQNLKAIKDKCVQCDNPLGIAWATG